MLLELLSATVLVAKTFGITISENTVSHGTIDSSEMYEIFTKPDFYWSIFNNEEVKSSNVTIGMNGGLYVTNNLDTTTFSIGNFDNAGNFSAHNSDIDSTNTFWFYGSAFSNKGDVFLVNSGSTTSIQVVSDKFENKGIMVVSGDSIPSSHLNVNIASPTLSNSGVMCFTNQNVRMYNVNDAGCINLSGDSTFTTQWNQNKVYINGTDAKFIYEPRGGLYYNVVGFGGGDWPAGSNGNMIHTIGVMTFASYNPQNGVLKLQVSGVWDSFVIGKGYLSMYFVVSSLNGNYFCAYMNEIPDTSVPSTCLCAPQPASPTEAPEQLFMDFSSILSSEEISATFDATSSVVTSSSII